jgi:pyruvate kinase
VANAIFEGTDAVMLSGETAVGRYPTRAVQVMDRIARRVEEVMDYAAILREKAGEGRTAIDQAVSLAACQVSLDLQVGVMICSTFSGATARFLSQKRPKAVIFATSPNEHVVRQLALAWGVYAVHMERPPEVEALVQQSIEQAKERGLVSAGDIVTAITGLAGGTAGSTNMLRVLKVD